MDSKTIRLQQDILIRAMAKDDSVRIVAVSGASLVTEAQRIHKLSRVATAALGRQLLMTAIMASDLKSDTDRVSTIINGDGPGGNMVCTGLPNLDVKGTILHPEVELPPTEKGKLDVSGFVGNTGRLTVVRDLSLREPYVGSVNLVSGEIAEDFLQYYVLSQQQPSIVYLGVRVHPVTGRVRAAGGILVQPMPGCDETVISQLEGMGGVISSLTESLDNGTSLPNALQDMFSEMDLRIVSEAEPHYRCDCNRERIERALIAVGASELKQMIEEDHGAELTCHFCNSVYRFDEAELSALYRSAESKQHDEP